MPLPLSFKSLIIILKTEASISKPFLLLMWQKRWEIRPGLESILKRGDLLLNLHWPLVLVLVMNGVVGKRDCA